jgi:general secretion pathway protein F
MQFTVRALTADNRMQTLIVEGTDLVAAKQSIATRGLKTISIEQSAERGRAGSHVFSVFEFSQELVALLEAGLSIVEAIEGLAEKEGSPSVRAVYERVLGRLREGQRLSASLRADAAVFDALFVGIVQAAEGTSDLPRALSRYVDFSQRMRGLRSRVVSASIYPAILLAVGGGVALFLMGYVVPRFAQVYQDSGRSLPWASQLLLDWGRWVGLHPALTTATAIALSAGAVLGARAWWRSGRLMAALSRLPLMGERVRVARLAQTYLTLGMLLEGGIPILAALDMLRSSLPPALAHSLAAARAMVSAGDSVSHAFDAQDLATPIALRMLRVGERSGQLGAMLSRAAQFHEAETARWIERFSRVIEPLLMALIGILVGLIVILLYMPIFDLAGSIG